MKKRNTFKVLIPIFALFICAAVVLLERYGVTSKYTRDDQSNENLSYTAAVEEQKDCLILVSALDDESENFAQMMEIVLDGMKVGYDEKDIADVDFSNELSNYQTAVITFQNWSFLGDNLLALSNWVKAGGNLMNTATPEPNSSFGVMCQKLGIVSGGTDYTGISSIHVIEGCMIGATEDNSYNLVSDGEEPLEISLSVQLDETCQKYVESGDGEVPLLWSRSYGDGTFVILNDVLTDKYQRGFLCLAYSLLGDACIYPVINGSAFYLDDFPSPVPSGDSEYIERDYGIDTATFYSSIWWPTVLSWEEDFGIKHTGMIIEEYSDDVTAPFERNDSTTQFVTFGNMLLNNGGELGLHGYNHMPLCLKGVDDDMQFAEYSLWDSTDDMKASLTELNGFASDIFPNETFSVYVPPSNILTETGEEALLEACPDVKVIASSFLTDSVGKVFEQEFGIEDNGIIDTPRIISGCELDDYQMLTAFAELNFQYVNSHFMHPDDVLDEDRGADLGWEELSNRFYSYLTWLYGAAPDIRNLTGSEMGTAVSQYTNISINRQLEDNVLTVNLGGFSGEAYFLLRVNEGDVKDAEGCTYEKVIDNVYEIDATQDQLKIYLQ